jgi:hypothetical protein
LSTTAERRWRCVVASLLVVLAAVSATVGVLAGWAERTLFDKEEFANRATTVLESAAVREVLADQLADRLVEAGVGNLSSFRSVLVPLLEDIEETDAFREVFRNAIVELHSAIFQRDADRAVLELGDTLGILTSTAQTAGTNRDLLARLPSQATSLLVEVSPVLRRIQPWRIAERDRWLDDAAWVVTAVAVVGAVVLDRRRRRTMLKLGVAAVAVGAAVVAVTAVVPRLAAGSIDDANLADAVRHGANRFLGDLRQIGFWIIPIGAIVAAAATATGAPHLVSAGRRAMTGARSWLAGAGSPVRGLVGLGLVAAGALLVVGRELVVPIGLTLLGAVVGYTGVVLLLAAVFGPAPALELADHELRARTKRDAILATVVVAVSVLGVITASAAISSARQDAQADEVMQCNGYAELCSRRLDQVTFAGSHNSMSAASDPGWLFAENLHGIPQQLEYGIRAFLLKSHYGIPTGVSVGGSELVVTDENAEINANEEAEVEELSPEAVARAKQLQATVAGSTQVQHRDIYLCHVYCSLGATKLSTTLTDVKAFLDRNPNEVIMLFIGDYVTPEDTAAVFEKAGLLDRLWTNDTTKPPPTLGEMIEAKRNLLVLSEHAGGTPPWYTKGYGIFQDTPFTFAEPSDFSCAVNRGPANAPLFEVNHFITNTKPPSVQVGREVNSYNVLMGRVRQCMQERQLFPTIVAVNFYDQGDLLRVVNELNGVS